MISTICLQYTVVKTIMKCDCRISSIHIILIFYWTILFTSIVKMIYLSIIRIISTFKCYIYALFSIVLLLIDPKEYYHTYNI